MEQLSILWPAATFLVLYTGLLFGGFSWMLKSQIKPIRELLGNHITGTNKKIDDLRSELKSGMSELKSELKSETSELRSDVKELKSDIKELKTLFLKKNA